MAYKWDVPIRSPWSKLLLKHILSWEESTRYLSETNQWALTRQLSSPAMRRTPKRSQFINHELPEQQVDQLDWRMVYLGYAHPEQELCLMLHATTCCQSDQYRIHDDDVCHKPFGPALLGDMEEWSVAIRCSCQSPTIKLQSIAMVRY